MLVCLVCLQPPACFEGACDPKFCALGDLTEGSFPFFPALCWNYNFFSAAACVSALVLFEDIFCTDGAQSLPDFQAAPLGALRGFNL